MKGIINLLEQIVVREHGDGVWETLLDHTGLSAVYPHRGSGAED